MAFSEDNFSTLVTNITVDGQQNFILMADPEGIRGVR